MAWKGGRGGVFRWRGTEVRWRGAFGVRERSLMVRKCDEHANPSHPLDVFLFVSGVVDGWGGNRRKGVFSRTNPALSSGDLEFFLRPISNR